jgi:hypothetical protein
MDFEIVGDITPMETFAVGKSIRELPRLRGYTAPDAGGNEKE